MLENLKKEKKRWEEDTLRKVLETYPERKGEFTTISEMNIERFSPAELDLSKLEQICSTLPFLSPRRVVIAEQPSRLMGSDSEKERFFEFLNSIPTSTALVLIESIDFKSARGRLPSKPSQLEQFLQSHPSAYIRRCEIPRGPQFVTWIQEHTEELGGTIG